MKKSIYLLNNEIIIIGTNTTIFFVNFIKKEKIRKFRLEYEAFSICYFNRNIFFGFKSDINSCLLFEYIIIEKFADINIECIGKGKDDKCLELSSIQVMNENTIITSNKNKYIKIWDQIEKKPCHIKRN